MPTAELIVENVGGFAGEAYCYKLSEPLKGHSYVTVLLQVAFGPQDREAAIFPAHPSGAAVTMTRLPGSYVHPEPSREWALLMAGGYEVVAGVGGSAVGHQEAPDVVDAEPFERTMRVYEVAYKLDVPSARVIEALEAVGVDGKTPNSNVEPVDAVRVRDYLNEVI